MLTKTTVSAIRALVRLGLQSSGRPISPKRLAGQLGESPTYLAKVMRLLVKAGILRAHYGVLGGVVLNRCPDMVSLLNITEACQGAILANLCAETDELTKTCAFHQAGAELHRTVVGVMSRWTLADFLRNPNPSPHCDGQIRCWMRPTTGRQEGDSPALGEAGRRPKIGRLPLGQSGTVPVLPPAKKPTKKAAVRSRKLEPPRR